MRRSHFNTIARMQAWLDGYRAARDSAAWAESPRDVLVFSGEDWRAFLHGMLSADIKALPASRGTWTCALTPKGKLVARFALYETGGSALAVCDPGTGTAVLAALAKALPLSKTKVQEESSAWTGFHLFGPGADALGARLLGGPSPRDFMSCRAAWGGAPCWALAYPALLRSQLLLLAPSERAEACRAALAASGAAGPLAPEALEALRLEAGFALPGRDFDGDAYPLELGMEGAISFEKGCFMGQETVAMMKNRGHVNRRLVGLAGRGAFSPALGRPLALALVPAGSAMPGTRLREGEVELEVVALPVEKSSAT